MALRKSIFYYACFCYCIVSSSSETDTLKQGDQLTNDEYLVSAGKVFTLGFFSTQNEQTIGYFNPESAQNFYIGIWYTYDNLKRPVWIANRNKPVSRKSGSLTIDSNTGDFKVLDKGLIQFLWKSDQNASFKSVAVLKDTGNLVLHEQDSDRTLWQSFDHPTSTLLMGMRLGFNYKEGKTWSLSSWISDKFPATGPYSLGLDPNGTNQLILWRRGQIQWRSGIWHKGKFPNLKDYLYKFDYVSNDNETYFSLSANTWYSINFPMYYLDWKGVVLNFDSPRSNRLQYSANTMVECERHNHHPGCIEYKLPECQGKNWFDSSSGYALSEGFKYGVDKQILAISDCEEKCFNNCSCVAYASVYTNGTGCEFWSNMTLLQEGYYGHVSRREVFIRRERYQDAGKKHKFLWVWLIVATACFLLLLALAWLGNHIKRKLLSLARCLGLIGYVVYRNLMEYLTRLYDRLQNSLETAGTSQIEEKMGLTELESSAGESKRFQRKRRLTIGKKNHGMQMFSFQSIVQATNNFSPSNKLGRGGYGIVYKVVENKG